MLVCAGDGLLSRPGQSLCERLPDLKSVPGRQKSVGAVSEWGTGTDALAAMDEVKHDARGSGL